MEEGGAGQPVDVAGQEAAGLAVVRSHPAGAAGEAGLRRAPVALGGGDGAGNVGQRDDPLADLEGDPLTGRRDLGHALVQQGQRQLGGEGPAGPVPAYSLRSEPQIPVRSGRSRRKPGRGGGVVSSKRSIRNGRVSR